MESVVNRIAAISACWGILLATTSFVFIVIWSPGSLEDHENHDVISASLFSQAILLALGCIQTLFSVLVLASYTPQIKHRWTTTWICIHIIVVLGLVFFFIIHEYMETSGWIAGPIFTTLDLIVLCDFLFLSVSFVTLLWCWEPFKEIEFGANNMVSTAISPSVSSIAGTVLRTSSNNGILNPLWASNPIYGCNMQNGGLNQLNKIV